MRWQDSNSSNAFVEENISRISEETEKFRAELKELDENKDLASEEIRKKEEKILELRKTISDSAELFKEIGQEIEAIPGSGMN